jgi:hypothetical protein
LGAKVDFLFEMANLVGKYMFFNEKNAHFNENKGNKKPLAKGPEVLELLTSYS